MLKDRIRRQSGRHSNTLHLKLPNYNGTTDIDEYLNQFIAICEFEEWDDEEAAIILLAKLQGDALSVAAALDDQTLRSLTTNLRRHFAQDQEEVATLKKTRDRLARDAFVNAVSDEKVREKLRDRNPTTLADAVTESKRLTVNK